MNPFICDETIIEIMKHITEGKDPSTWTKSEHFFAYFNRKIPANIHFIYSLHNYLLPVLFAGVNKAQNPSQHRKCNCYVQKYCMFIVAFC